ELIHHEGGSRGRNVDPAAPAAFRALYNDRRDPYYNPNLSLEHERLAIAARTLPPRQHHPIRTAICAQDELTARLHEAGVLDPVVVRTEAIDLCVEDLRASGAELVYACGAHFVAVDASTRIGLPSVWSPGPSDHLRA